MKHSFSHLSDPLTLPAGLHRPVLAVGNFDGVHRGHKQLIAVAAEMGKSLQAPVVALSFEPHPRTFFQPDKPLFRLSPPDLKAQWLHDAGAQALVTLRFDKALAAMTAEEFVRDILIKRFGIAAIVIGHDFHFGRNRQGSPDFLQESGQINGFAVAVVPPVTRDASIISSSSIRAALSAGDIALANHLLGHAWAVRAEVVHGDKRGRELGYPTANLLLDRAVTLQHGIYAVQATVDGQAHPAVASFGRRPTFDDGAPRLEVHLFDFSDDLYGKTMEVAFVGYIRPELKFDGVEALIKQMDNDSLTALQMLTEA